MLDIVLPVFGLTLASAGSAMIVATAASLLTVSALLWALPRP